MIFGLKSTTNPSKINQKSIRNQPKWCPGALRNGFWKQVASRTSKSERPGYFFDTFWRHLGDFGCHFGASWAAAGSQNQAFWDRSRKIGFPKSIKKTMPKKDGKMMPKAPKMMPKWMPKSVIFHAFSRKAKTLETICFTI